MKPNSKQDFDWSKWEGVDDPGWTQIPDIFFDFIMPHITPAEFKVLMYIARHTWGYRDHRGRTKEKDSISLKQMVEGITCRDGTVQDYGTGLSRAGVIKVLKSLEANNLITVERIQTEEGDSAVNSYSIRRKTGSKQSLPPQSTELPRGSQHSIPPETTQFTTGRQLSEPTINKRQYNKQDDNEASLSLALQIAEATANTPRDRQALVTSLSKFPPGVLAKVKGEIGKRLAEGHVKNPGAYANRLAVIFAAAEAEAQELSTRKRQKLFDQILSTAAFELSTTRDAEKVRHVLGGYWPGEGKLITRALDLIVRQ